MKLNRQIGSKSFKFYKYFYKDEVHYVSSILRFFRNVAKGRLGRSNLDKLALKKIKEVKGWTCKEITKEEYKQHLQSLYDQYISTQNQNNQCNTPN